MAAIDAGSNAFRLIIARVRSVDEWDIVESVRAPVRLGHTAFTSGKFDLKTLREATVAFRHFRRLMDLYDVVAYRAVATSAAREALNRHVLVGRIRHSARINLEIISGDEEARLVRVAVLRAFRGSDPPRFILDLGGGSLELNELRRGVLQQTVGLPLGTVRLMEKYHLQDSIDKATADGLRRHVIAVLRKANTKRPSSPTRQAVVCGGNAETLAHLAPGPRIGGLPTLSPTVLADRMTRILDLDVAGRMAAYGVRRDRAEVMGVAAIVLLSLARWLHLRCMITPLVGVREGLLYELAVQQMEPPVPTAHEVSEAQIVRQGASAFAARVRLDLLHGEQVRALALQLFDKLWIYHRMDPKLRTILEVAALLHDSGYLVHRKAHHRHGEYLVRNGKIAGLRGWAKNMTACLVRYHNGKSEPSAAHKLFKSLNRNQRKQARILSGMLRLAECLESDHRQAIAGLTLEGGPRDVQVHVILRDGSRLNLSDIEKKARLLERELRLHVSFQRVLFVEKARMAS